MAGERWSHFALVEIMTAGGVARRFLNVFLILLFVYAVSPLLLAQGETGNVEWRAYAADSAASKYSPLDQITADNFSTLDVVWQWESADTHLVYADEHGTSLVSSDVVFDRLETEDPDLWVTRPRTTRIVATPIMVDGVLYISTPLYQAAAIDARTGKTLWVHDPRTYASGTPAPAPWVHRGVSYWENDGDARIVWGTGDGYLIAVDAQTGIPAEDFGENGRVDLVDGLPRATRGQRDNLNLLPLASQSAPLVIGDTIIVGSSINDFSITKEMPPGFARAYDARTGRHRWDFHNIPQSADEFGVDTWLNESWRYSGNANVWANISADEELGYVYLPTSTPTSDYYGGHRLGDNLFAESLICVDLETGERVWHFQMVHHGVWDYDNPTAPNLLDITVDGRRVKAVAQVTKQGFVYTFNRITGEPIWPIEERAVAVDTDLNGEVLAPTQPFPTKPPAFDEQGATLDDLVDFTPEIREMAVTAVDGFRLGPLYTPLSLNGTIFRPSAGGGANWSGAAVDPETGVLYVPSRNVHSVMRFRDPEPEEPSTLQYILSRGNTSFIEAGNPVRRPVMPQGLPLWKPPYSRMTAIDMNRGEHLWMTPLGNGDRYRNHPLLRDLDLPPLGGDDSRSGPLLTKTLLIHALTAGSTDGGPHLVAYDKGTGDVVASVGLPSGAIGTPMTYMLDGRQYIALTVGGEVSRLIAFALPQ